MSHEYITDLPKNIAAYRKNQVLIAQKEKENTILEWRIQRLENLDEYYKRGERAKRAHRLLPKVRRLNTFGRNPRKWRTRISISLCKEF